MCLIFYWDNNGFSEVFLATPVYALVSVNLHKFVLWKLLSILFVVFLISISFGICVKRKAYLLQ
jgi:hypothetical protein